MTDLLSRIQSIFRDVFDDPLLSITTQTTASDVSGWDSLTNINLISSIEREFKIRFALGEIQQLNNVGEMVTLVHEKMRKISDV